MAGTPPIISAGWRPSNSVTGHANSPPKTAPKGRNACRKEFNVEIKIYKYTVTLVYVWPPLIEDSWCI